MNVKGLDLITNFDQSAAALNQSLRSLTEADSTKFADKVDLLLDARLALVPFLTAQLRTDGENKVPDRSREINNLLGVISSIESAMYRKRDMEAKEEVDLSHPKIQKALEWVITATTEAMKEVGIPDTQIANYVHKLAQKMVGFEEEANKRLRGVNFQKLDTLDNPLTAIFRDVRSGRDLTIVDAEVSE